AIVPVIQEALREAGVSWPEIDAVAVAKGPGLAGALLVGVNVAKAITYARGLPLIGVNHIEAHIYANWLVKSRPPKPGVPEPRTPMFPLLALIVSGGHTELVLMRDHGEYQLIGKTRDDAAGEAFDKVARILGLGYPGGPAIQNAASAVEDRRRRGTLSAYQLPRAWLRGTYDFSFSGLKTAVLRLVEGTHPLLSQAVAVADSHDGAPALQRAQSLAEQRGRAGEPAAASGQARVPAYVADIAASFQEAVVDVLVAKTLQAAQEFGVRQIALAGGVSANRLLREQMAERSRVPVIYPDPDLCTDNAAMIASAGYFHWQRGDVAGLDLDIEPTLRLVE
ncbi:MAG: tRNA (adenosine(37)-N6)-threonylcarbamoyltransferase complex transferase subunit TsaD, partial [Chloroflexota bacterium]